MKKYVSCVIYCDCLECPYLAQTEDYTCTRDEVYLDQGDCLIYKQLKQPKEEA